MQTLPQVFHLSEKQARVFEVENPDTDCTQSWLSKSGSVDTSASELSSSESSRPASAPDSDALASKVAQPKRATSGSESDVAGMRKEVKKLQIKNKKAEATADNLKKKLKQDGARIKTLEAEVAALRRLAPVGAAARTAPRDPNTLVEKEREAPTMQP
jgi:predicted RNase H-like nuclease (RuvC/YqgF family)